MYICTYTVYFDLRQWCIKSITFVLAVALLKMYTQKAFNLQHFNKSPHISIVEG